MVVNDVGTRLREVLGHRYAIGDEIGVGGMAMVFAAQDLRHRRQVAIKVLRPDIASALGAERFLQEIQTSANLRHPHILPLFDSGDAGGSLFYVMPLVTGETLRKRLVRERQLPVDDAVQIAKECAGALAYAHSHGVIHRDIKPDNILLESGHAVIADFGIARVVSTAGSETLTQAGTSLGTPQYMSPEQIAGEADIDGRSDLYSLACVLYEMLAGQPPFTGPTMERLYYQQLMETPPTITRFRSPLPPAVVAAIRKALAKSRGDRHDSMTAFAAALSTPAVEADRGRSVAVLPFLNMSTDPENEYFADGITEDVIAQLSKIRALQVVSRTSVMPFKKREHSLRDIAANLGVGTVLDGSVRKAGARVRIVAQLIDAETDKPLWSETFDRDLTDIFAIQSEVALRIANALQASLTRDEQERIERRPTEDIIAYQNYLLGRQSMIRFTTESMMKAIELFERAVDRDPGFAQAHAAIASASIELGESGALPPERAFKRAGEAVQRALDLDPQLSAAHATLGYLKTVYEYDWAGAEAAFMRAIELSPSNADAWDHFGRLMSSLERHEESLVQVRRAHALDPLTHRVDVATALLRAGRFEEAIDAGKLAVELGPDDARPRGTLGWAYFLSGDHDTGVRLLEEAVALEPGNTLWFGQLGEAYGFAGETGKARAVLAQLVETSRSKFVTPYHFAYVHTGLGELDDAITYLEQAYERRSGAVYGIKGSFLFKPLHGHARFTALLRRMNLA
jgi:serine/threonine protein kinase/tetratricopeptide (TPR) repeat protein